MNDLRPDEVSDDESPSKLIFLDPGLGTDRLDVEGECSTCVASSPVWGLGNASSCQRIAGSNGGQDTTILFRTYPQDNT